MSKELKRFEKWWDAEDDIPNNGPYTPDTPIQFAWAGWQAALAKPTSADYAMGYAEGFNDACKPAQQEPVAWMFQHEETGRMMCVDAQQVELGFEKFNPRLKKIAPLYTSPPAQRTWVGLLWGNLPEDGQNHDFLRGAVWAEAKLKELNT